MAKCSYSLCNKTSNQISMFRFPVNDKPRLLMWIKNSGNDMLMSLTNAELSHRFICAVHFRPTSIHIGKFRSRLLGPAVPEPFRMVEESVASTSQDVGVDVTVSLEVLKLKTPTKVYGRRTKSTVPTSSDSDAKSSLFGGPSGVATPRLSRRCLHEEPRPRISRKRLFEEKITDSPNSKKTKRSATKLLKKTKAQQAKIFRLKSKVQQDSVNLNTFEFNSEVSKTLTIMQFRKSKERKPWNEKEKKLCLSFFYKTPSGYEVLRRQGVILAAPSTIRKWLSETNCSPGFCKEVFNQIKIRFESSTVKEKACVVSFDEMSLMENIQYSKKYDCVEGFEDLGGNRRSNKLCKYALVFVARGLFSNWKLPVAYFLSNTNVKANDLQLLVKATLNKLFDCGLLPKATVCDQMTTNQKIYKDFGVSTKAQFFYCNGRFFFAFFDVPHLIKNVRNIFF